MQVAEKIYRHFAGQNTTDQLSYWIEHIEDRPYNDSMYWTDGSKLEALGWKQRTDFDEGLAKTVRWHLNEGHGFWH